MKAGLAIFCIMLAGCTTAAPVKYIPTSQPYCAAVQIVCVSKEDQLTEPTSSQIEANNIGISHICKKKVICSKPKPTS